MINNFVLLTPSQRDLYNNIGLSRVIPLENTTLQTSKEDIVLFTGSISDKAEINYRTLTNTTCTYITIIPDEMSENEIDSYWFTHTIVLQKSLAETLLRAEKVDNFLSLLETVDSWAKQDIESHEVIEDDIFDYLALNTISPINVTDNFSSPGGFLDDLKVGFRVLLYHA